MKAFGYSSAEVAGHYFKFILAIAVGGALLGCLAGVLAGRSMAVVYLDFFKFPFLVFRVDAATFVTGFAVSVLAASAGGAIVLRGVFALTPAVAMRPPAPPDYSRAAKFGPALRAFLDQPSRMVLRRLWRQPLRAGAAAIGIGAGMALSVGMLNIMNAFDRMMDLNFNVIERADVTVSFTEPLGESAIYALRRIPGVISAESFRSVPAILRNGRNTYRGAVSGLQSEPRLHRAVDADMRAIYMRSDGLVLSKALARILEVEPGDMLRVEVRDGRQPVLQLPVAAISETLLGAPTYLEIGALNRALKEPGRVSGAYLRIDDARKDFIYQEIKAMPIVAGVAVRADTRAALKKMLDTGAGAMRYIMAMIAGIITFGIVYNSARIAFAERARDLASLRVIGFTKGEASFVLLGELALITLAALPVGSILGYYLSYAIAEGFSTDLYQIPVAFSPQALGVGAVAVVVAAVISGLLVKRDIDRIDLVSALKIRE